MVNKVIVTRSEMGSFVRFYTSKKGVSLSQFPAPESSRISEFNKAFLPSITVPKMLEAYPISDFVKIDMEHYAILC